MTFNYKHLRTVEKTLENILKVLIDISDKIPDPNKREQQEQEKLIFNKNVMKAVLSKLYTGNFYESEDQQT